MGERISDEVLEAFAIVTEPAKVAGAMKERFGGVVDRVFCTFPFATDDERRTSIFATFSLRGDASRRKRLAAEGCPRAPRRTYRYAFGPLRSEGRESDAHSVPSRRGIMNSPG
jgi:hypothetical protein